MIDMHSHILPGIDDGARTLPETLNMLREAEKAGFKTVIATSHFYPGRKYTADEKERVTWVNAINKNINNIAPGVNVVLGNEIFVSNQMIQQIKEKQASTINGTRYVLFELPFSDKVLDLKNIIYDLISNKYIPIIAHPERYEFVQKNPNILLEYLDMGVLFQANYGSLIGQYGTKAERIVKLLIQNNFIHFMGSDAHRKNGIYENIHKSLKEMELLLPKEEIDELIYYNAKLVLEDEVVDVRRPQKIKRGIFGF